MPAGFDDRDLQWIGQLDPDGTYRQSDSSRWLPVKSEEVERWLLNEDTADEGAWAERLKAWARDVLAGRETRELGSANGRRDTMVPRQLRALSMILLTAASAAWTD